MVFTGHDDGIDLGVHHHFERALPIDEAMLDGVILAWEANGQPLPRPTGSRSRLVVPTWYGMASVKWLKAITVIDHPFQGVQQKPSVDRSAARTRAARSRRSPCAPR